MKVLLLVMGLAGGLIFPVLAQKKLPNYELILDDDSIYVEQFAPAEKDENRFTANNTIYVVDRQWTYDYYYETKTGQKLWFEPVVGNNAPGWRWVSPDSAGNNTIRRVQLTVKAGLGPFVNFPGYNQTIMQYDFLSATGSSSFNEQTGIVENEKNVWMHPPRSQFFKILELNPFPYIEAPYQIGRQWRWRLAIGDHWQDGRWKTWSDLVQNTYQYEITGVQTIQTPAGTFRCYEVRATATSRLGHTHLTAYFNQQAGFVRLDYVNIDGSKTVLSLNKLTLFTASFRKP